MPCIPFKNTAADGTAVYGFICTGKRMAAPCCVCGKPSTKLCDGPSEKIHAVSETCSKPLCAGCAFHVVPDRDYCPAHRPN